MIQCPHGFPIGLEHGGVDRDGDRWVCINGETTYPPVYFINPHRSWWRRLLNWMGR